MYQHNSNIKSFPPDLLFKEYCFRFCYWAGFDQISKVVFGTNDKCNRDICTYLIGWFFSYVFNNNNNNKTLSLVSNSSLNKPFALASLESLKFRSSTFSLHRSSLIEVHFGSKKNLGLKKCWLRKKKFGSTKMLEPTKLWIQTNFGPQNILL